MAAKTMQGSNPCQLSCRWVRGHPQPGATAGLPSSSRGGHTRGEITWLPIAAELLVLVIMQTLLISELGIITRKLDDAWQGMHC